MESEKSNLKEIEYRFVLEKILKESHLIIIDGFSPIDDILTLELDKEGYSKKELDINRNPSKKILYSFYTDDEIFENNKRKFKIEARYSINSQRYYVAKKVTQ